MRNARVVALMFSALIAATAAAQSTTSPASKATTATATPPATARWDARDHFHKRVAEMREDIRNLPDDTTGTIVMVGDSITEGFFKQEQMPERITGLPVLNQGISGDQVDRPTSGTGVTHRVELVKQARPALVFVMIGVNDFWGGKEETEDVLAQYEKMFRMLKSAAPEAKFVWQSVLPASKEKSVMNPQIEELNKLIARLADVEGDTWLDLHPVMADDSGQLKAEFTNDGVHLTKPGYQAWLQEIERIANELSN